ncbi:REP-associated tyrosine transposase [Pseudomonas sp. TE3610]
MKPAHKAFALRTGRYSEPGRIYLVTTVTEGRLRHFDDWRTGRLVAQQMRLIHEAQWVESLAWVIMPDHLHWIFALGDKSLGEVMCRLKARSSLGVNSYLGRKGRIWQKGFHDRALRKEDNLKQMARYVIANPLRAGLVNRIGDYPLWDVVWI